LLIRALKQTVQNDLKEGVDKELQMRGRKNAN